MRENIGERYIGLLTDFGFKRIFGTELNKELCEYEDSRKAYRDLKTRWIQLSGMDLRRGMLRP